MTSDDTTERILRLHRSLSGSRSEAFTAVRSVGRTEEYDLVRVIRERQKATERVLVALLSPALVKDALARIDELTEELITAPLEIELSDSERVA